MLSVRDVIYKIRQLLSHLLRPWLMRLISILILRGTPYFAFDKLSEKCFENRVGSKAFLNILIKTTNGHCLSIIDPEKTYF